jgi:hypothetical protein
MDAQKYALEMFLRPIKTEMKIKTQNPVNSMIWNPTASNSKPNPFDYLEIAEIPMYDDFQPDNPSKFIKSLLESIEKEFNIPSITQNSNSKKMSKPETQHQIPSIIKLEHIENKPETSNVDPEKEIFTETHIPTESHITNGSIKLLEMMQVPISYTSPNLSLMGLERLVENTPEEIKNDKKKKKKKKTQRILSYSIINPVVFKTARELILLMIAEYKNMVDYSKVPDLIEKLITALKQHFQNLPHNSMDVSSMDEINEAYIEGIFTQVCTKALLLAIDLENFIVCNLFSSKMKPIPDDSLIQTIFKSNAKCFFGFDMNSTVSNWGLEECCSTLDHVKDLEASIQYYSNRKKLSLESALHQKCIDDFILPDRLNFDFEKTYDDTDPEKMKKEIARLNKQLRRAEKDLATLNAQKKLNSGA